MTTRMTNAPMETTQFETLILPHEPSLYGTAYQLTRNSSDAEDLVQDTMLRAYTRFDSFREDGSPRAWLHTIMRNLYINGYRKRRREPQQVSFDALQEASPAAVMPIPAPAATSPERVVLSRLEEAALLRAVTQLPRDFREVVLLADVNGLSYQEIADRLRVPVGTVRSRLNRGRKRVQRALFSWQDNGAIPTKQGPLVPA